MPLSDRFEVLRLDFEHLPGLEPLADPLQIALPTAEAAGVGQLGRAEDLDLGIEPFQHKGDVTALKGYVFSNPPNAADAAAIREDLRSGISYGSTVISRPAGGALSSITIMLDHEAIAAINSTLDSASLLFAIGGFSDTLTGQQLLFQSSAGGPNIARLDVIPTPIPAVGLPGMVMALGGMIVFARRRRKAAT